MIFKEEEVSIEQMINTLLLTFQDRDKGLGLPGIRKEIISSGLELLLHKRRRDRERDRLNTIRWDHQKRVDEFFIHQFGLAPNAYHRLISRNFWLAMAARIMSPGEV